MVPPGTYLTGALYFKQGVNLYVSAGATLKGSDDISDYDLAETRIEKETCLYFTALINADGVDGFTMCGPPDSIYRIPISGRRIFTNAIM